MDTEWTSSRLTSPVHLSGVGVHSGETCHVTLLPGESGSGCWLHSQGESWPARPDQVVDLQRCTVLGTATTRVSTVEHLFAALAAARLYDCQIHVEGPEIPILDGSALPFWEAIEPHLQPGPPLTPLVLRQPVWVGDETSHVLALPCEQCEFHYALYYPHPMLGYLEARFAPLQQSFAQELAPARTFALEQEVAWLRQQGLARGGSLDNALVVSADHFSSPLRVPAEPARHKCLDLVGDLYLLGRPLQARVVAVKAGHRWHVELARKLTLEVSLHAG